LSGGVQSFLLATDGAGPRQHETDRIVTGVDLGARWDRGHLATIPPAAAAVHRPFSSARFGLDDARGFAHGGGL
jgi:hypothetical protein